jgi:hypothetical protein
LRDGNERFSWNFPTIVALQPDESPTTNTPEKFAHLVTKTHERELKRQLKNFFEISTWKSGKRNSTVGRHEP